MNCPRVLAGAGTMMALQAPGQGCASVPQGALPAHRPASSPACGQGLSPEALLG